MDVPVRVLGLPQEFLGHAARGEILEETGLTGTGVAAQTAAFAKHLLPAGGLPDRELPARDLTDRDLPNRGANQRHAG